MLVTYLISYQRFQRVQKVGDRSDYRAKDDSARKSPKLVGDE
jgi:hypothetical protein